VGFGTVWNVLTEEKQVIFCQPEVTVTNTSAPSIPWNSKLH